MALGTLGILLLVNLTAIELHNIRSHPLMDSKQKHTKGPISQEASRELLVAAKRVLFPDGGRDYTDGKEALLKAVNRAEEGA